jgi:hypothetical protein
MAENHDWSQAEAAPPQPKPPFDKKDFIIALILFVIAAPFLLVSFFAIPANIMSIASLADPVANQGATFVSALPMLALAGITSLYPVLYLYCAIQTFADRKVTWKSYLVLIGIIPMIFIIIMVAGPTYFPALRKY